MGKLFIANEAIDFQTTMFGKELEGVFAGMKNKYTKFADMANSDEVKIFESIIKRYTNLNVTFRISDKGNAANRSIINLISDINIKDIFKDNFDYVKDYLLDKDSKDKIFTLIRHLAESSERNKIDLKNNKVYGYFKKVPTIVNVNFDFINNDKFTPGMLAAFVLHEVGHTFTALEFLGNTIFVNQFLTMASAGLSSRNPEVREYVFKELDRVISDEEYVEALKELTDSNAITGVLLKALHVSNLRDNRFSIFNTSDFDNNYGEALADTYAARVGYGRELIEGLHQMDILYKDPSQSIYERLTNKALEKVYILTQVSIGLTAIATFGSFPILNTIIIPLSLGMFVNKIEQFTTKNKILDSGGYDIAVDRVKRVKNQIVTQLKYDLDPVLANKILEDLKVIEKIIATYKPYNTIFNRVADFIYKSSGSKYRNAIKLQQDLELLVANDLFIKATQLNLI